MPQKERRSGVAADADKAPQSVMLFRQTATSHPSALNAPSPTLTNFLNYEAPSTTFPKNARCTGIRYSAQSAALLFAEISPHGSCRIERPDRADNSVLSRVFNRGFNAAFDITAVCNSLAEAFQSLRKFF